MKNLQKISLGMALIMIIPLSSAQELEDVAQWCYASTDLLSKEAGSLSEYGVMKSHLADVLANTYNIDETEAKINGSSELIGAAGKEGVTVEKMALTLYTKVCKPVFVQ